MTNSQDSPGLVAPEHVEERGGSIRFDQGDGGWIESEHWIDLSGVDEGGI